MAQDILGCYVGEYAKAQRLSELERPWGLGGGGLEALWLRLAAALKAGVWTVRFSADNGLTAWMADIRIDGQAEELLSFRRRPGA